GLLGALKDAGHTEEEANVYSEGVRRGGALVSVKADDDDAARIEQILNGRRGIDARTRGEAYRSEGWSRFDQDASPYTAEQVRRERTLYGAEDRSFADAERDPLIDDEERRRTQSPSGLGATPREY
ncbi:MAG: hypothetical protein WAL33_08180, partial [Caulobacter sp.]